MCSSEGERFIEKTVAHFDGHDLGPDLAAKVRITKFGHGRKS